MGETRGGKHPNLKTLMIRLRAVFDGLPTESEKQEMKETTAALIGFLSALRDTIDGLPSGDDVHSAKQALGRLESLLASIEANPVFATALGLRPRAPLRQRTAATGAGDSARAKALLAQLEALPIDEIRAKLQDESLSLEALRLVAAEVGIRQTKRVSREDLSHQVAMKIANYRGYQQLSGETKER